MKKLIVLGLTGSIASIKSFDLCRLLRKSGFDVQVVMSRASLGIIPKATMEWASDREVITSISGKVEHVKLFGKGGKASLFLIAPATANTISKVAMGIDDTPITTCATTAIGSGVPVLIAPAMHEPMYDHPIVQKNIDFLEKEKRIEMISPLIEEDKAKMAPIEQIVLAVERAFSKKKLEGKKVLIANAATYSKIDPMRIITNLSSGKTGRQLQKQVYITGGLVKLIEGGEYNGFCKKTLSELKKGFDYFVVPAALNDFEPKQYWNKASSDKKLILELFPSEKLISIVRKKFPALKIVAFKAETNKTKKQLEQIGRAFLKKTNVQLVVVNDVSKYPAGSNLSEMGIVSKKKVVWIKGLKEKIAKKIVEEISKI